MNVYEFDVFNIDGTQTSLREFEGEVLLIVNTALDCGFAPQYSGLEHLYQKYRDQGFSVLDFPCNQFANQSPLSDVDNLHTCQLKYKTTFPMFAKVKVNGEDAIPLYKFLRKEGTGFLGSKIKWNFTKFLVDRNGHVVKRYGPRVLPSMIEEDIVSYL